MMRLRHVLLASAFVTPYFCVFSYAQAPFAVGTASAAPGQKATGYLAVPAGADAATNIPVVVVNGAKPGKVLALVSGAHGTERSEEHTSELQSLAYLVCRLLLEKKKKKKKQYNTKETRKPSDQWDTD